MLIPSPSPQQSNFYPPLLLPPLVRVVQHLAPPIGLLRYRMRLTVAPEDVRRLQGLRSDRVLLLANHPTFHDWVAMFLLSARLRQAFYYLAAYERFRGANGWLIQRLGAYSIRRGLGDRASVQQTVQLLMQPRCHLVIFPEGGCSFQNDTVMPFREGAVQIAFQALNRLTKQAPTDLYVVPIAIKYRYTQSMSDVIHRTLARLEQALNVPVAATSYQRLRTVAEQVLISFEQRYGVDPTAHDPITQRPWNDRISQIRLHLLQSCEQRLGLVSPTHLPVRERVYLIQAALEARAEQFAASDFWTYDAMHEAAWQLLNFDAIYDGYVAEDPTSERFLDTLVRLEREVFKIDQPPPKGDRQVILRVGEAINLKNHLPEYRTDRAQTVQHLTQTLQKAVQQQL